MCAMIYHTDRNNTVSAGHQNCPNTWPQIGCSVYAGYLGLEVLMVNIMGWSEAVPPMQTCGCPVTWL